MVGFSLAQQKTQKYRVCDKLHRESPAALKQFSWWDTVVAGTGWWWARASVDYSVSVDANGLYINDEYPSICPAAAAY